jgi:hypothetical protein
MKMNGSHFRTMALAFLLSSVLAGCGSEGGGDGTTGTVRLAITDQVAHNFGDVVISIKEVRAVPAGSENADEGGLPLIVSYPTAKKINVLELQFQQQLLGEAVVPAGKYSQLRLVLESNNNEGAPANYVTMAGDLQGIPVAVDTPSAQQSGLKVVGGFDVQPDAVTAIVLDFDPGRAIVEAGQSGKWNFKPTGIRVTRSDAILATYGGLTGEVHREVTGAAGVTSEPLTEATVYAIPYDTSAPTESRQLAAAIAAGPVSTEDGTFRLLLPPGFYEVRVTAAGFQDFTSWPKLFEVTTGEDTVVTVGADTEAGPVVLKPISPQ